MVPAPPPPGPAPARPPAIASVTERAWHEGTARLVELAPAGAVDATGAGAVVAGAVVAVVGPTDVASGTVATGARADAGSTSPDVADAVLTTELSGVSVIGASAHPATATSEAIATGTVRLDLTADG